uniref:Uncharacterized protein n=1 Tax=Rhizophagus irregularis (strain DAOM 181602 / DAOM 197198 / MUCL 43194) TaxID=747089 RepID=U9STI0_RHIID
MSSNSKVVIPEHVSFRYFKLVDFEKVCHQQIFKLPSEILTPELLELLHVFRSLRKLTKLTLKKILEGLKRQVMYKAKIYD